MDTTAQTRRNDDFFSPARTQLETIIVWLQQEQAEANHADTERGLYQKGIELMRRLYQAFLDHGAAQEERRRVELRTVVRARTRGLESLFGAVKVPRLAYTRPAQATEFPRDQTLNLPSERYSLPVREKVAVAATQGSFDHVVTSLDKEGGAHVPKRQVRELVAQAAQDVDAFYGRNPVANDVVSSQGLLVLTSDSKGVTMRPEALREATRKAAEQHASVRAKSDPMAAKKARKHDKRMAIVTAVYEQERFERSAEQFAATLRPGRETAKAKPPPVEQKRVRASVEKSQKRGIRELFDEADRRDPARQRTTVVLVDGEERQRKAIEREARTRTRPITTIVDVMHVLHYLWSAAKVLCAGGGQSSADWVQSYLLKLLLAKTAIDVAAGIRQAATLRGIARGQSKGVDDCIRYLRNNARRLRYREFLDYGFPIATGVIEGACRHLVQDRMGITGAKWGLSGAEAVLKLRAVKTNGDWEAYWRFHEQQEFQRHYAAKAA
jgi:hypothetical protein